MNSIRLLLLACVCLAALGGIQYRTDQPMRGFSKQITCDSAGFSEGIKVGRMPIGSTPMSIRIVKASDFATGAYVQMGFSSGGVEWTGYIYVDSSTPRSIEALAWVENVTPIPLGAPRDLIIKGSGAMSSGALIVQVTYLD